MKIQGEVGKLENSGDGVNVTITNVKRINQASWQGYGHNITLNLPLSKAKNFAIGRVVKMEVKAS